MKDGRVSEVQLQDDGVGEGDVSGGAVDGGDEGRVDDFGADFGQAEDGEAAVVAAVLEVVRVLPHQRQPQFCQTQSPRAHRPFPTIKIL